MIPRLVGLLIVLTLRDTGGWLDTTSPPAVLRGTVIGLTSSKEPIAGARVIARRSGEQQALVGLTDSAGRFELGPLQPGRYSLMARRAAYLDTPYGAIAWPGPGVELFVSADQSGDELSIAMPRGGAIGGVVRFVEGSPAPDVLVDVYRALPDGTIRRVGPPVVTDDRGAYRAFGLQPGEYYVVATPASSDSDDARFFQMREVDAALARLVNGNFVASSPDTTVDQARAKVPSTFFPSSADRVGAVPIRLGLSDERLGADIILRALSVGTISGVAIDARGHMAGARITLESAGGGIDANTATAVTQADGSFRFEGVSPGSYVLRGTNRLLRDGRTSTELIQLSMQSVSVASGSAQQVSMVFAAGHSISGTVRIAATDVSSWSSKGWSAIARPLPGPGASMTTQRVVPVDPDNSFRLDGLFPGKYVVDVVGLPDGATIEVVRADGHASLGRLIDVTATATSRVDLDVSYGARVSGRLLGPNGVGIPGYSITIFPAAAELRHSWLGLTRLARTASDGSFSIAGLPSGSYLICAFVDVGSLPDDVDFLRAAEGLAVAVRLAKSSNVVQNLMVVKK